MKLIAITNGDVTYRSRDPATGTPGHFEVRFMVQVQAEPLPVSFMTITTPASGGPDRPYAQVEEEAFRQLPAALRALADGLEAWKPHPE